MRFNSSLVVFITNELNVKRRAEVHDTSLNTAGTAACVTCPLGLISLSAGLDLKDSL